VTDPPAPFAPGSPAVAPVVLSSYFHSAGDPDPAALHYGRIDNPTWGELEADLGRLEGATSAVLASGQAATHALLLAARDVLGADPLVAVVPDEGYYNTRALATALPGVEARVVDQRDLSAVSAALAPRRSLLWVETPTNPLLRVLDLQVLAATAHRAGCLVAVDNTLATPALQRPLDHGADATMTSLTKGASGHSDVILGAVATRHPELAERVRAWRTLAGGIGGPMEVWLARRGLSTLDLRARQQSATAAELARRLGGHRAVRAVYYPSPADPITARQLPHGCGGIVSFVPRGDTDLADRVVAAAHRIAPGTSFGGVASSWERRRRWGGDDCDDALIRLSVGIEPVDALWADVAAALESATG
jgi:cystathionine gamma-synthase